MNDQPEHPLIAFLSEKMTMTDVYQPAIVKDLLEHGGVRSKSDLAGTLAAYNTATGFPVHLPASDEAVVKWIVLRSKGRTLLARVSEYCGIS